MIVAPGIGRRGAIAAGLQCRIFMRIGIHLFRLDRAAGFRLTC